MRTTPQGCAAAGPLRLVDAAIRTEVTELCCEILELEPFEITPTTPLERYPWRDGHPEEALAATLECAFGVRFEFAQLMAMVDLEQVCAELELALRRKRSGRPAPPTDRRAWLLPSSAGQPHEEPSR